MAAKLQPLSDKDQATLSGPRDMKDPGDVDWCWQTISALQSMWKSFELDYDRYTRVWQEAEEHRIWEKVPPGKPYGSREAFIHALEIGDDAAAQARVSAVAAKPRKELPHGQVAGPGRGHKNNGGPPKVLGSHNTDYIVRRIARDRPDIWERMKDGEFSSVAAAAREAGIPMKDRKRVNLSDPQRVAAAIREHFAPDQIAEIVQALQVEQTS